MSRFVRRPALLVSLAALMVVTTATPALAHGIGGRADLPVPLEFFVVGAGIAIVASFLALAVLWPEPRLQGRGRERDLGAAWLPRLSVALSAIGLIGFSLVVVAGVVNRSGSRTISPVLVWVYFWLVVPFLAAVIGNWWRSISPWRTLAMSLSSEVPERTDRAAPWGVWPAAAAFVAFTWLELVADSSDEPRTLAIATIVYTVFLLGLTRYLGVETGLRAGGAFEMYNGVISAISPLRWSTARVSRGPGAMAVATTNRLTYRGWLRGLTALDVKPGFTFFVIAMIGTVSYDGMSASRRWSDLFDSTADEAWFGTLALLGTVAVVGIAYWLASFAAARSAGPATNAIGVARSFAHTLVPIAFAYAFAHYFTLILVEGQLLIHTASDPFGLGWNLFGTADWTISWVPSPEIVWYIQVAAIVGGHIAGVMLAHDRALHEFGGRVAVRTQYAMLALMVALTSLGLVILAG